MYVIAAIPARSTIARDSVDGGPFGRPLLWHVWNRVRQARRVNSVFVMADTPELTAEVRSWGGTAVLAQPAEATPTGRIASFLHILPGELIICVEGGELPDPGLLDDLVSSWMASGSDIVMPVKPIRTAHRLWDRGVVKVVRDNHGRALYFSRAPLPFPDGVPAEQWIRRYPFWSVTGIYAYRRDVLEQFSTLPASPLAEAERFEPLRFLEAGYRIETMRAMNPSEAWIAPPVQTASAAGGR